MGASEIYAVDSDSARLRVAEAFEATATLASDADPAQQILDSTHGSAYAADCRQFRDRRGSGGGPHAAERREFRLRCLNREVCKPDGNWHH